MQETLAKPDKTLQQVSEGAHSEPSQPDIPIPPTPLEMTEMIEEQANPNNSGTLIRSTTRGTTTITADSPGLQEENQPLTTIQSGQAICQLVQYQQSLTQCEQGLVAWEVLLDQDEQETTPTVQ